VDPFGPPPFVPLRASLATAQGRELAARADAAAAYRPLYPDPRAAAAREELRLRKKAQLEVRVSVLAWLSTFASLEHSL
jgi:hypothetical protein